MPDRLESMSVFVRVAETGSFTAAANALGISAQMVARHVEALEARLSLRLIHRTTRSQGLTEFGQRYRDRCKAILAEVAEAEEMAAEHLGRPCGAVRLNAPVTFGSHALMPVITAFLSRNPGVEIDLSLTDRMVDPLGEDCDAVIRIGPLESSAALIARPLAPYRLIACAAPAYLARCGTPRMPEDLKTHECLGYSHWSGPMAREWRFTRGAASWSVPVSGRLRGSDWKALHQAALLGFGITLGPVAALAEDLAAGRLVRVLPEHDGPKRPMHLIWPKDRQPPLRLRLLLDFLIAHFRDGAQSEQEIAASPALPASPLALRTIPVPAPRPETGQTLLRQATPEPVSEAP